MYTPFATSGLVFGVFTDRLIRGPYGGSAQQARLDEKSEYRSAAVAASVAAAQTKPPRRLQQFERDNMRPTTFATRNRAGRSADGIRLQPRRSRDPPCPRYVAPGRRRHTTRKTACRAARSAYRQDGYRRPTPAVRLPADSRLSAARRRTMRF